MRLAKSAHPTIRRRRFAAHPRRASAGSCDESQTLAEKLRDFGTTAEDPKLLFQDSHVAPLFREGVIW
jgi:hypothetical protein